MRTNKVVARIPLLYRMLANRSKEDEVGVKNSQNSTKWDFGALLMAHHCNHERDARVIYVS